MTRLVQMLGVIVPANAYDPAAKALLRKNYLWVSRLVHPDKCQLPNGVEAFRAVEVVRILVFAFIRSFVQPTSGPGVGARQPVSGPGFAARLVTAA